jgi:antitoxin VapB
MTPAYVRSRVVQHSEEVRTVSLFRNARNQAVRIPADWELPGTKATMRRDGDRLIIEPVRKRGLIELLRTMEPYTGEFPAIEDLPLKDEEIF